MSDEEGAILYIASRLPALSETFVWREVLELRARGVDVVTASVRTPESASGDSALEALARESVGVYGPGVLSLVVHALLRLASQPIRSLQTLGLAALDAARARDHRGRHKIVVQAVGALALAHRLRKTRVWRVHAHMAHVPTTIAMYLAHHLRIGFSFTGHANDLFHERALLREKLERCDFVACISRWHREFYRGIAPIQDDRMPIVRCGVEVGAGAPSEDQSSWRILSVGRFVEKKGFDTLIEAVSHMPAEIRGKRILVTIIGDGPMREQLENLIAEGRNSERIALPGAMANRDVHERLRSADLFVLPCRTDSEGDRDGIPVVLMEAMAHEVCSVAGRLETIRELIPDDSTGILLAPEASPDAYAEAITALLEDDHRRRALAREGRCWVEQEFSIDRNVGRLLEAFSMSKQRAAS